MKIGELALKAECDVQTIRFYEREGLLQAPAREPSNHRRYVGNDLERLRFIRHCRSLDIPLPDIRQLLAFAAEPSQSCSNVNALLDKHIAQVRQRLKALRDLDRQLVALRARCDGDASHECAILASFMDASSPSSSASHAGA
ncbi:Cd(II)/Pb(II)-responsive transcriptional regulator [Hylemonella gracilis]|nr:Cd(II)/Pb(II)-responsive transcriptional regulator [Hylemonella gracilis]